MQEIWKDIAGYEGLYQVSNLGRVKSLERWIDNIHHVKEKILKPTISPKGYLRVHLRKDKKEKVATIHQIVMRTFNQIKDNNLTVDHIDNNKLNNSLTNLQLLTARENTLKWHKEQGHKV
jgi:hypothetical protein